MSYTSVLALLVACCCGVTLANDTCGVPRSPHGLIYGGKEVRVGEFPWLVPLFKYSTEEFFCSSNLISRQHLLTVAHCIQDKQVLRPTRKEDIYAFIGRYDTTKTVIEPFSRKEGIKIISIHEKWKPQSQNFDSDIALLTLYNRVQFNDFVQPVCLPDKNFQMGIRVGSVVGFGKSEVPSLRHEPRPKRIDISSQTNDDCFFTDFNFARIGSPSTFCAGELGRSPCKGDSGGGFFIHETDWRIAGLVSAAIDQDCAANKFVLFTNVAKFTNWIERQMAATDSANSFESIFNNFDGDEQTPEDANLVNTDCKFESIGSSYGCSVNGLVAPDSDIKLSIQNGRHKPSRTNRDVSVMHVKNGQISHFPDMSRVIETFPNLQGFGVTFNKMKHIKREEVKSLDKLKFFLISDNEIEVIPPDTFVDMKELELIDICRNKIATLEAGWVSTMPKLKVFKARSNLFKEIPKEMFLNNPQLEEILFDFNPIERNYADYMHLKNLKNLAMLKMTCTNLQFCKDPSNNNCVKSLLQFSYIVKGYCGSFTE